MAFKVLLYYFGWVALVVSVAMILIPYFRRTHDLLSAWSLFMVGCANFIGIAAIQSGSALMHDYVQPQESDYLKFVSGGAVFFVAIAVTYFLFEFPDRIAPRILTRWGSRAPRALFAMVPICLVLTLGKLFIVNIQFIGQWLIFFGSHSAAIAVVFCLICWFQRPQNLIYPLVGLGCLLVAAVVANLGLGRRDFLTVMVSIPLTWYWMRGRYLSPLRVFGLLAVCSVAGFVAIAGVSAARFQKTSADDSVVQSAWAKLKSIPEAFGREGSTNAIFGGDAVDASLATIRLYEQIQPIQPFFTLEYIAAMPVPRAWWPDKPEALGATLPIDIGWVQAHGFVNLGPGIIGHGWHEGGLPMHAFYGCLFAFILRLWDSRMRRDPNNPYLIAILACASGQLVAFARGDIALFSTLIIGAFVTGELVSIIARILFGTERFVPNAVPAQDYVQPAYQYELPPAGSIEHTF